MYIYKFLINVIGKIFLHKEQAIRASRKYPNCRVEIFVTNVLYEGYEPMYEYYKNGLLYKNSKVIEDIIS